MIHTQSGGPLHSCRTRQTEQTRPRQGSFDRGQRDPDRPDDFAGGIASTGGVDKVVRTKETGGSQSAILCSAVALLDGDVMPAQFEPDRIMRCRCAAAPQEGFGPAGSSGIHRPISCERCLPRLSSGYRTVRSSNTRFRIFQGSPPAPSRGRRSVVKSSTDSRPVKRPTKWTCREIKDAVHSLENIQVADLMALLGRVKGVGARH